VAQWLERHWRRLEVCFQGCALRIPVGWPRHTREWRNDGFKGKHTFRQSARDMLSLLDHLGIHRVKAVGLSGGGITLLHMATLQPDRIEAMIAISAPPYFPSQARALQRAVLV